MAVGTTGSDQPAVIAGELVYETSLGQLNMIDPSTGKVFTRVPRCGPSEADRALRVSETAAIDWAAAAPAERARILNRIALIIREHAEELAILDTLDVGKPLWQSRADAEAAARYFEFYGGIADKWGGDEIPVGLSGLAFTFREPLGVSLQLVPWNFPLKIAIRGIAPALAAGCSLVCKPSQLAGVAIHRFAMLAQEAGLPGGLVQVLSGTGPELGSCLVHDHRVRQITFTGGEATGRLVMRAAGERVVPVTLELGGKSAALVLPDADIDSAASAIASSICEGAGQNCDALSRLIVLRDRSQMVIDAIVDRIRAKSIGRGLDNPDMGPLISRGHLERVTMMVEQGVQSGAKIATGGPLSSQEMDGELRGGFWYRPTVLLDVEPSSHIAQHEIFGPVVSVIRVNDVDSAIQVANGTRYGLSAAVFTSDAGRAFGIARALEAGQVHINGTGVGTGVELPFGGVKDSGFGREKGLEALRSYSQVKTVTLPLTAFQSVSRAQ